MPNETPTLEAPRALDPSQTPLPHLKVPGEVSDVTEIELREHFGAHPDMYHPGLHEHIKRRYGMAEDLGDAATGTVVEDVEPSPTRRVDINGTLYETNVPDDVDAFEGNIIVEGQEIKRGIFDQGLRPVAMDALPVGQYYYAEVLGDAATDESPRREFAIRETDKGNVVETVPITAPWAFYEANYEVMVALGFDIQEENGFKYIAAAPTPETLKKCAEKLGLNVKLFLDKGELKGREYLGAYAEGAQPVAAGDEAHFVHDTQDDHITAVVFGGKPLMSALQGVAIKALESGDEKLMADISQDIDNFTATLRGVTLAPSFLDGSNFGIKDGWKTLVNAGQRIGLPEDVVLNILKATQASAITYGVDVKPLEGLPEPHGV